MSVLTPRSLTAILQAEGDGYVALCPELDVASEGDSIEQARENLQEAVGLFFECASEAEIQARLAGETYITQIEIDPVQRRLPDSAGE